MSNIIIKLTIIILFLKFYYLLSFNLYYLYLTLNYPQVQYDKFIKIT